MPHGPEPWTFNADTYPTVSCKKGRDVAMCRNKASAERIVACVNVCKGIPTAMLEQIAKYGGLLSGRYPDVDGELQFFHRYAGIRPVLSQEADDGSHL